MKLEGMDEFAQGAAKAARALENFGQRTQAAGRATTRFGLQLLAAGLLLGLGWLLLYWIL